MRKKVVRYKTLFLLAFLLATSVLVACGNDEEQGAPTPSQGLTLMPTETTTPVPVLEVGQSAQLPGFIITLRRAIWEGDRLETYWVFSNNGTNKIDLSGFSQLQCEATDSTGNRGDYSYGSPKWDDDEKKLPGISSPLWPGEQAVAYEDWEFGPLSKGIQVKVYYTEWVSYPESRGYQVMWNTGR